MYIYIYIYICMNVNIYIYIDIYIYTYISRKKSVLKFQTETHGVCVHQRRAKPHLSCPV